MDDVQTLLHSMVLMLTNKTGVSQLPECSELSSALFDLLLLTSASMNTSISTPSTITISTTMTIATITPTGRPEPTGGEVVSGEGRNELV